MQWYGWQTLLVDGAAIAFMATGTDTLVGVGAVGYFFGPPTVHFAHGHVAKGFGSMGMRLGAMVLFVGGLVSCWDQGFGESSGGGGCPVAIIGAVGLVAAIPIDAAALAHEEVPVEDDDADDAAASHPQIALAPFLRPVRRTTERAEGPAGGEPTRASRSPGFRAGLDLRGTF